MAVSAICEGRRILVLGALASAMAGGLGAAESADGIYVISRERVLRDIEVARSLSLAERDMTAKLQALVDETGATLSAEEAELARVRSELPRDEFERRAADFDRRRRLARSVAQDRAQTLQRGFQEARAAILEAMPAIIEQVRAEVDARIVLDADQVMAAAPGVDLTERVVEIFNAKGPRPSVPDIELTAPILEPPAEPRQPGSDALE